MKLKLLFAAVLLGLAVPAAAEFITTEQAYEVALSTVRLPQSDTGTIAFKACRECDYQTERVTEATRWLINGQAVPLEQFRKAMRRVENRETEAVMILHHLAQDRITRVSVYL